MKKLFLFGLLSLAPLFAFAESGVVFNQSSGTVTGNLNVNGAIGALTYLAGSIGTMPQWVKYTKTYVDFSSATTQVLINLGTLPIGAQVHAIKVYSSIGFTGGGASLANLRIQAVDDLINPACDIFAGANSTTFYQDDIAINMVPDQTGTIALNAMLTSDVNLDTLSAGSVSIWVLVSVAI